MTKQIVAQSCSTIWDLLGCSPPGSSVHGIFQARILEWVAISSSRRSSWPRIEPISPVSPALQADSLPAEPLGEPIYIYIWVYILCSFSRWKLRLLIWHIDFSTISIKHYEFHSRHALVTSHKFIHIVFLFNSNIFKLPLSLPLWPTNYLEVYRLISKYLEFF